MKKFTGSILIAAIAVASFVTSATAATKQSKKYSDSELRSMDTNKDDMVSKDEFMAYSEMAFSKMKLTDGTISLKSKSNHSKSTDDSSSMNNKPIGTTADNPNVNERDAINGKHY